MQTYDLIMLAVLAAATIFGFWKGLAWQIASLASIVASYFLALKFKDQLAPMLSKDEPWNKFLAMLVIYAGASLVIWTGYRFIGSVIDRVKLNEFDRQMGALVGFAKGVLLCIAITFFAVTLLSQSQREQIIATRSGRYIVQILDKADAVAPPEIRQYIGPYIQKIKDPLDPNYQPEPSQGREVIEQLWRQQSAQNGGGVSGAVSTLLGGGTNSGSGAPATNPNDNWPVVTPPVPTQLTPAIPVSSGGSRR